ncbi:MAG: GNAT family N-acetyltransferase [Acidobacteriota bacterium]
MSASQPLRFSVLTFDELDIHQLHELLKLRVDVFILEQECVYPEIDGRDPESVHILGHQGDQLVAYARWYFRPPKDQDEREAAGGPERPVAVLGRILTASSARGQGLGRDLVAHALEALRDHAVRISAQHHLEAFYQSLGFRTTSPEPYDWDGIPHIDMVLAAQT